jgi:hypothetical protein
MNLRETSSQSCAWTADHRNFCEEESTRGVYPTVLGESPMPLRNNQRTACNIEHSVEYRTERGKAMTEEDRNGPAC